MTLTAAILSRNEENKLLKAIQSVKWADEILLVDSGSTDGTIALAEREGARIFKREFKDFSDLRNFALKQMRTDWIFFIDADERCDILLKDAILSIAKRPNDISAYAVRRRNVFLGKELRFGGQGHDYQIRLFRNGRAYYEQPVHEIPVVNGKVDKIVKGSLIHETKSNINEYLARLISYTDLEAALLTNQNGRISRVACMWKPFARFVYFYVLKLGFLDGFHGFVFHLFSSYYYLIKLLKSREIAGGSI